MEQETTVSCDGGDDGLGHPKVFLAFGLEGFVVCPYCGKRFERAPSD